jgi:hypothetical protein
VVVEDCEPIALVGQSVNVQLPTFFDSHESIPLFLLFIVYVRPALTF